MDMSFQCLGNIKYPDLFFEYIKSGFQELEVCSNLNLDAIQNFPNTHLPLNILNYLDSVVFDFFALDARGPHRARGCGYATTFFAVQRAATTRTSA